MSLDFIYELAENTLSSVHDFIPSQEAVMAFSQQGLELLNNATQTMDNYAHEACEATGIDTTTLYAGAAALTTLVAATTAIARQSANKAPLSSDLDYSKFFDFSRRNEPVKQQGALFTGKKKVAVDSLVLGWLKVHGAERSDELATQWKIAYNGTGFVGVQKVDKAYVTGLILEKLGVPKDGLITNATQEAAYQQAYERYVLNSASQAQKPSI